MSIEVASFIETNPNLGVGNTLISASYPRNSWQTVQLKYKILDSNKIVTSPSLGGEHGAINPNIYPTSRTSNDTNPKDSIPGKWMVDQHPTQLNASTHVGRGPCPPGTFAQLSTPWEFTLKAGTYMAVVTWCNNGIAGAQDHFTQFRLRGNNGQTTIAKASQRAISVAQTPAQVPSTAITPTNAGQCSVNMFFKITNDTSIKLELYTESRGTTKTNLQFQCLQEKLYGRYSSGQRHPNVATWNIRAAFPVCYSDFFGTSTFFADSQRYFTEFGWPLYWVPDNNSGARYNLNYNAAYWKREDTGPGSFVPAGWLDAVFTSLDLYKLK